jgi:hypothetical protein
MCALRALSESADVQRTFIIIHDILERPHTLSMSSEDEWFDLELPVLDCMQ